MCREALSMYVHLFQCNIPFRTEQHQRNTKYRLFHILHDLFQRILSAVIHGLTFAGDDDVRIRLQTKGTFGEADPESDRKFHGDFRVA